MRNRLIEIGLIVGFVLIARECLYKYDKGRRTKIAIKGIKRQVLKIENKQS